MSNLPRRTPVQQVLRDRPYIPWGLLPVAAVLCVLDYDREARDIAINALAAGRTLDELARRGTIEPDHVEAIREASRRWHDSRPTFGEWLEQEGGIAWQEGR